MEENQIISDFPSPQDFVTETPPYADLVTQSSEDILQIEFFKGTIDTYCPACNRDSVYQRIIHFPDALIAKTWVNDYGTQNLINGDVIRFNVEWDNSVFDPIGIIEYTDYVSRPRLIAMDFVCTRDSNHHLYVFAIAKENSIVKIGQFPSLADLQKIESRKYRKVLGDTYPELARAIGLSAHGVGIGAYVYLRRIFEKLLEEAHAQAKSVDGWDEEKYQQSRVIEKIELLQDYLPNFLKENKGVYGILSKGIHELTEEECLEYFAIVLSAIELILDERLQAIEREEKTRKASNQIALITGKLKTAKDEQTEIGATNGT